MDLEGVDRRGVAFPDGDRALPGDYYGDEPIRSRSDAEAGTRHFQ